MQNPELFSWPIRVYWEDTDAGGVVYHAQYVNFLERARTEWLRSHNIHQSHVMNELNCAVAVKWFQVNLHFPCRLDDLLTIKIRINAIKKTSIILDQLVYKDDNNSLVAEGCFCLVCIRPSTFKPCRIPQIILTACCP